jgi:DNA-directed RNA polymerase specialized sigma subunit
MSKPTWYADTLNRLSDYDRDQYLTDFAINMLSAEKQFILRKRFIEGNTDSEVIKLLEIDFGIFSRHKYCKLRDKAISELSKIFGYQEI